MAHWPSPAPAIGRRDEAAVPQGPTPQPHGPVNEVIVVGRKRVTAAARGRRRTSPRAAVTERAPAAITQMTGRKGALFAEVAMTPLSLRSGTALWIRRLLNMPRVSRTGKI